MNFSIDRNNGLPIGTQLKEQIKYFIMTGVLGPDSKLPPARQLATSLDLNKNTVASVYRELEAEGYLRSHQGSGTFINGSKDGAGQRIGKNLLQLVDDTIKQAMKLGYSPDQFATIFYYRAHTGVFSERKKVKVILIGCAADNLEELSQLVTNGSGMDVQTIILSDLRSNWDELKESIEKADFLITYFGHYTEVKEMIGSGLSHRLIGLRLESQSETTNELDMLKSLFSIVEDASDRGTYTPEIVDSFVKWHLYHYGGKRNKV